MISNRKKTSETTDPEIRLPFRSLQNSLSILSKPGCNMSRLMERIFSGFQLKLETWQEVVDLVSFRNVS